MKLPLLELSIRVIFLTIIFSLLNISEAFPIQDSIPGNEAALWDIAVKKFYGPWSEVRKLNGEYADYNDYGAHIQDFQPGPEDIPSDESEVAEDGPADFQSNYGEIGSDQSGDAFQSQIADNENVENQDNGDEGAAGDPENHDLEGYVKWTSSAV